MFDFNERKSFSSELEPRNHRLRIMEAIKNVIRDRLQAPTNTHQEPDLSEKLRVGLINAIRPIRPIKQIQIAKPFTKLDKVKKKWDPDHTSLVWKN